MLGEASSIARTAASSSRMPPESVVLTGEKLVGPGVIDEEYSAALDLTGVAGCCTRGYVFMIKMGDDAVVLVFS